MLKPAARAMRHEPTAAELALWQGLRSRGLAGAKFRRQSVIDRFIVDFVCLERKLIVEVDGDIHDQQPERDAEREAIPRDLGYRVVRVRNEEVMGQFERVLARIEAAL